MADIVFPDSKDELARLIAAFGAIKSIHIHSPAERHATRNAGAPTEQPRSNRD